METNEEDKEVLDESTITEASLTVLVKKCIKIMKAARDDVNEPSSSNEPYKNIYKAIESVKPLIQIVQHYATCETISKSRIFYLWTNFTLVHVYSSLAKWSELCEELTDADSYHLKYENCNE